MLNISYKLAWIVSGGVGVSATAPEIAKQYINLYFKLLR